MSGEPPKGRFMKIEVKKEAAPPPHDPPPPAVPLFASGAKKEAKETKTTAIEIPSFAAPPPPRLSLCERADLAAAAIRDTFQAAPRLALILGSGLGAFADSLEGARSLFYEQIPGFSRTTVAGHAGRLVYGKRGGVPVLAMQGRFHFYEGYSLEEVTFPVRVFGRLGVRLLIVTNAAGGISERLAPGDIMMIEDHLNLIGASPLRGPNDERLGPRFPDMSEAYPERFRRALAAAAPKDCPLKSGVYAAMPGPSYETPAEIRMLARLGADAVGMSSVPEAIVANHMGIGVLGLSGIANMAAGVVKGARLTHAEVVENMNRMAGIFRALLEAALPALDALLG
jgi:purine-nucleoside phosphorylase